MSFHFSSFTLIPSFPMSFHFPSFPMSFHFPSFPMSSHFPSFTLIPSFPMPSHFPSFPMSSHFPSFTLTPRVSNIPIKLPFTLSAGTGSKYTFTSYPCAVK